MAPGGRKVAFSGKRKKEQLLAKRRKKGGKLSKNDSDSESNNDSDGKHSTATTSQKINTKPQIVGANRYALKFFNESENSLAKMRKAAYKPLKPLELNDREIDADYFDNYDFPIRPSWNYSMSKQQLDRIENEYFNEYTKKVEEHHKIIGCELSLFEMNLETWRQLWRVLEMSDVILVIVDIRYPALMFPPSLYAYIKTKLMKGIILILNKIDLVRPEVVIAWRQYFLDKYPGLLVTAFSSHTLNAKNKAASFNKSREGLLELHKCIKKIVGSDLDLSEWEKKILSDVDVNETESADDELFVSEAEKYEYSEHVKYKNGVITIGCVGFPNVGKSSVLNAINGKKVVSVSRTPGHTKYFQTIFVTNNVKLCDCPGLVFPSSTPKSLQVILGSYPIAQLREPYGSIRFVAERINLPKILSINLPDSSDEWSPFSICEAWANKKGFLTAKAARPDTSRAANNILQLVLQGRVVLEFFPKGFVGREDTWTKHSYMDTIRIISTGRINVSESNDEKSLSTSESEDENSESSDESQKGGANAFAILSND